MAIDAQAWKARLCHALHHPRADCWEGMLVSMSHIEMISGKAAVCTRASPQRSCLLYTYILQRHLPTWALPDKCGLASCDRLRCGLQVVSSILSELKVGDFLVKVSHRQLLDAMLTFCGVPKEKFHPICSAIDKLDKEPWEAVRAEMVDQKGLPADVCSTMRHTLTALFT